MPLVSAVTVSGEAEPVAVPLAPPSLEMQVAVYWVGGPPEVGGLNATRIYPSPGVSEVIVGAPGTLSWATRLTALPFWTALKSRPVQSSVTLGSPPLRVPAVITPLRV